MGSLSHCPIGVSKRGALSAKLLKATCREVRLNAQEQPSWNTTAVPCPSLTFSMDASMSFLRSSIADLRPIAYSVPPTIPLRLVSFLRMAERASLVRVAPTVMGLTLPFGPLRRGVALTLFKSSSVSWRRRPPSR